MLPMANTGTPPLPTVQQDQELVETIVYLASLASEPAAIDHLLDVLRYTTAAWDKQNPLPIESRQKLIQLRAELTTYLIQKDPIRAFDAQTLADRVARRNDAPARDSWLDFRAAVLISLGFGLSPLILPIEMGLLDRIILGIPVFLLSTTIINCWFYLSSLKNFKPELRQVFLFWCLGCVGMGLQFVQFVTVSLLDYDQLPLHKYGGLTFTATISMLAFYMGLREYAHLLTLKTRFASLPVLAAVLAATSGLAVATSHILSLPDPPFFSFSLASLWGLSAAGLFAAGVARTIMRSVTASYAQSLRWLYIFASGVFLGALGYSTILLLLKELSGEALGIALGTCALIPILILLRSGYTFKKETGR